MKSRQDHAVIKKLEVLNQLEVAGTDVTAAMAELATLNGLTASVAELNIMDGVTATKDEINKVDGLPAGAYIIVVEERTFTETAGAGTYTATVNIPAGSTILDVIWRNTALWTATTSATMKAGLAADDDMFFTGVDVKAAPAVDGTGGFGGISCAQGDAGAGAATGSTVYNAAAVVLTASVITVGAAGNAGRSRLLVMYATPVAVAASKA